MPFESFSNPERIDHQPNPRWVSKKQFWTVEVLKVCKKLLTNSGNAWSQHFGLARRHSWYLHPCTRRIIPSWTSHFFQLWIFPAARTATCYLYDAKDPWEGEVWEENSLQKYDIVSLYKSIILKFRPLKTWKSRGWQIPRNGQIKLPGLNSIRPWRPRGRVTSHHGHISRAQRNRPLPA